MPDRLYTTKFRVSFFVFFQLIIYCGNGSILFSQVDDTLEDTIIFSAEQETEAQDTSSRIPKKAAMYSALFPGMGQLYNKKYWKMPIVYAGFGTMVYFIDRNSRYYKDLKQKLIDPDYEMKYFDGDFTEDQLTRGKDLYKRWRDLSIIGTAGFYIFQIVDATVDAYLFDWDVGDNITFRVEPSYSPFLNPRMPLNSFGLGACISF